VTRTHWRHPTAYPPQTMCHRPLFSGGSHGRGCCYAEYDITYVDCRVCLYHTGRYVPLVKLREHQRAQQRDYLGTLALL
jgi:hypothetical protein